MTGAPEDVAADAPADAASGRPVTLVTLVTGNSSWWKARKYRREAAVALRRLRHQGYRCAGKLSLPRHGVDTRSFTVYRMRRAAD